MQNWLLSRNAGAMICTTCSAFDGGLHDDLELDVDAHRRDEAHRGEGRERRVRDPWVGGEVEAEVWGGEHTDRKSVV